MLGMKSLILVLLFLVIVGVSCELSHEVNGEIRHFDHSILNITNANEPLNLNVKEDKVSFFMIADWGGIPFFPYKTFVQQNVADAMKKIAREQPVHFTLALGDNFYFDGVTNVNDSRFQTTFEDVFTVDDLNMPWFMQLGNHDYYGNASAQLAYSKISNRWILPDYFYSVAVNINQTLESGIKLVHVMMIDTVILCGLSDTEQDFDLELKGAQKVKSDYYFNRIEDELIKISGDKTPYVIIAGHYPIWSVSMHGPTYLLAEKLRPLLAKYKVNAYFCGHDHDLEHFSENFNENQTVHYILNGATDLVRNITDHMDKVPKGSLKFYWASDWNIHGAICFVKATIKEMSIEFMETSGKLLHKITIPNQWL